MRNRDEFHAWEAQIALCTDIPPLLAMKEPIERCQDLSGVEAWDLLRQLQRRREELEFHVEVVESLSESRQLKGTFVASGVNVIGELPSWFKLT